MTGHAFATRLAIGALGQGVDRLRGRRRPWVVNHLVTVRCNLACPFCYVSGPEQRDYNRDRFPRRAEMDAEEMRRFYRELVEEGFLLTVVVGGEPLLRTDLPEVLAPTRGKMFVTVFTNGWLLAERSDLVADVTNLFVSLDAPDEQHDRLRDRPGTFQRAMEGIEVMRRRHPKVRLAINTTVTSDNADRVPDMLRFARDLRLPVAFQPPTYEGQFAMDDRPEIESARHTPGAAEVAEAFRRIEEAALSGERVIGSRAFFRQIITDRATYPCWYPTYVLGPVLPDGSVVACTSSEVIGNVRDQGVRAVLRSRAFRDNADAGPGCSVGCRDWGIHDLSAIYRGRFDLHDTRRYVRAFRSARQHAPPVVGRRP